MVKFGIKDVCMRFEMFIGDEYIASPASYYVVKTVLESFISDKTYNTHDDGEYLDQHTTYNVVYDDGLVEMSLTDYRELDIEDADETFKVPVTISFHAIPKELEPKVRRELLECLENMDIDEIRLGALKILEGYGKLHHLRRDIIPFYSS